MISTRSGENSYQSQYTVSEKVTHLGDPGRKAPGQAGVHSWKFKIVAIATNSIELVFRRSWDATAGAGHTFTLYLSCKKPRATKSATA